MKDKTEFHHGKEISNMKTEIINNLENPGQLEKLYRQNQTIFTREFNSIYPGIQETTAARIWNERLNFEQDEISWGSRKELLYVVVAAFLAGLTAKIPQFTGIDPEYFYPRNIAFIVFPFLSAYFAWKQQLPAKGIFRASIVILISVIYINLLPKNISSDTLILACIHLPLFLWTILGFTFAGYEFGNYQKRIDFLKYNGDLVVMTTVILISGGLLTGITIGLFELIGLHIEEFYFEYFGIWGLAAVPIVATYLVRTNPQLVNKVSPVIARVFTPLVFVTLAIYLLAIVYTGKDPYNDRDFLLIFNALLAGVMALILFSIAETSKFSGNRAGTILLFGLSILTILVNGIALSAIVFRISEWGITPNRLAVLGGNVLMLTNLLMVTYRLLRTIRDNIEAPKIVNSIASFLPIYALWTLFVTFVFPIVFNFK